MTVCAASERPFQRKATPKDLFRESIFPSLIRDFLAIKGWKTLCLPESQAISIRVSPLDSLSSEPFFRGQKELVEAKGCVRMAAIIPIRIRFRL